MTKTLRKRNTNNKTKKKTFGKNDFSSGEGFQTSIWGPLIWTSLHIISFNYPVNPSLENKNTNKILFKTLSYFYLLKFVRFILTKI